MKLTKKYSLVSVKQEPQPKKSAAKESIFTSIKRSLEQVAERVGSSLGVEQSNARTTFYLQQRPKDRQGRLEWNQKVDKVSADCKARLASYATTVYVARTGNEIEFKRKRHG